MSKTMPWVKYEELENGAGRFIAAPLKRGMGITLGNALRRVLLSSLSGHAVSSLKIEGVKHEFSTIPNVVEDVLDIICNIKSLIVKAHSDETKKLVIDVKKKGKVSAKDINSDSEIEIINPNLHIAEVAEGGRLKIEMTLEKGIGYMAAESFEKDDQSIDTINIDASFSPVVRVNHRVENIRVGKELDYDSLALDVWTNGSISPEDAVRKASGILVSKLDLFQSLNEKPEDATADKQINSEKEKQESAMSLTIDDLELSARSSNCLKRAGVETVGELISKDISELIQIKNFGRKSADEINDKLKQYGLMILGNE